MKGKSGQRFRQGFCKASKMIFNYEHAEEDKIRRMNNSHYINSRYFKQNKLVDTSRVFLER